MFIDGCLQPSVFLRVPQTLLQASADLVDPPLAAVFVGASWQLGCYAVPVPDIARRRCGWKRYSRVSVLFVSSVRCVDRGTTYAYIVSLLPRKGCHLRPRSTVSGPGSSSCHRCPFSSRPVTGAAGQGGLKVGCRFWHGAGPSLDTNKAGRAKLDCVGYITCAACSSTCFKLESKQPDGGKQGQSVMPQSTARRYLAVRMLYLAMYPAG